MININFINNNYNKTLVLSFLEKALRLNKHWLIETSQHCQISPWIIPKPQVLTTSCFTGKTAFHTVQPQRGDRAFLRGFKLAPPCTVQSTVQWTTTVCWITGTLASFLKRQIQKESWMGKCLAAFVPCLDSLSLSHNR